MPKGMLSPRFAFISTLSGNRDPADDLILAIDKLTNGRRVVIKRHTIPSSLMADRRALLIACDKFLCLSHSGIARPIDVLVDRKGGVIQTVVEYFPGKSFIETLKSLSSEHFLLAIAQCCSALHFLHSRNYAHLDLHPGNLVMIPEIESEMPWSVKLIDLPFLPLQELRRHRDLLHFNPKFSAPEIISGSDFDHRADLYSFGALLYAALVGDLPEVSSSSLQPHSLGRDEEQPHTDLIAPDYLASIVRKLLYKDPQKRYGSFFFLLSDLASHVPKNNPWLDSRSAVSASTSSVPLIFTRSISACLDLIDTTFTQFTSPAHSEISVSGLPGSGKTRTSRTLQLYFRVKGLDTAHASNLGIDGLTALIDNPPPQQSEEPSSGSSDQSLAFFCGHLPPAQLQRARELLSHIDSGTVLVHTVDRDFRNAPIQSATPHTASTNYYVPLYPFEPEQAFQLIEKALSPNEFSGSLKARVCQQALFLPGLIEEQLLFLWRNGIILRKGGYWCSTDSRETSAALSPSILSLLTRPYTSLTSSQCDLLALLSLTPYAIDIGRLANILGHSKADLLLTLPSLIDVSLVRADGQRYSLASSTIHKLVRSVSPKQRLESIAKQALLKLAEAEPQPDPESDPYLVHFAVEAQQPSIAFAAAERAALHFDLAGKSPDAMHFYRFALAHLPASESGKRTQLLTKALLHLGQLGNHSDFHNYAEQLERSIETSTPSGRAPLYALLAKLHREVGDLEGSSRLAAKALELSKSPPNRSAEASALATTAWNHLRRGELESALSLSELSVKLYSSEALSSEIRLPLSTMAGAYYLQGDYSRALKSERQSLLIARQYQNHSRLAHSCVNLGILYMESGELRKARRLLSWGWKVSEQMRVSTPRVNSHSNLIVFHQYLGDLRSANMHYQMIRKLLEDGGDPHIRSQSSLSHADSLLLSGQFDAAINLVIEARANGERAGDRFTVQTADLQRCLILTQAGLFNQSRTELEHLIPLLRGSRFRVFESFGLFSLAENLTQLGQLSDSQFILEESFTRMPAQNVICHFRHQLSLGHLQSARGQLHAALRSFFLAASMARRGGYRRYLFEAWLHLGRTLVALGDFDQAGIILRKLNGLHERIKLRLFEPWLFQALADHAAAVGEELESKKHLLNARTSLMELAYNISDKQIREHFLNKPDSHTLLSRSEKLEDMFYDGFAQPVESPQATRALESIARINEQLHRRDSLKSTLALIIDEALRLSTAERGIIFLFDASGREELKVSRNVGHRSLADARKYTRTALQRIRHGEIVFASDTFTDPQFTGSESITQLRIRSVACVPLRSRNSIIGALYLDSRRPRLAASADLLRSLEIFAQQAAAALERAIRYFHLAEENRKLRETALIGVPRLIGQGTYFSELKKLIAGAARSDLPVLILGESGTGKELVARSIHYSGKRSVEPFLSVDCGALPENLVESELFGYKRGAFTGADRDKEGLFVAARGGTLFLDEIGNTTSALQVKLLRAIQEREIRPLGATRSVAFHARMVAATNRDLRLDARNGRFRQDLLFRLNGITIDLPSLRERRSEIPILVGHFLQKTRERYGHCVNCMSDEAVKALTRYHWPGNIRELENCIERAVALAREETIHLKDLPDAIRSASVVGWTEKKGEHRLIEEALARFAGDKTRAAEYIGWNRQKLYRKMEQYNIPRDFGRRNTA